VQNTLRLPTQEWSYFWMPACIILTERAVLEEILPAQPINTANSRGYNATNEYYFDVPIYVSTPANVAIHSTMECSRIRYVREYRYRRKSTRTGLQPQSRRRTQLGVPVKGITLLCHPAVIDLDHWPRHGSCLHGDRHQHFQHKILC
jgi:hypothetical protein